MYVGGAGRKGGDSDDASHTMLILGENTLTESSLFEEKKGFH